MTRTLLRALALGCVGASLGGCVLTDSQSQVQSALTAGQVVASQLTPANLTALGATNADLTVAAKALSTVRAYTAAFCAVEPSLATVANISLALAGGSSVAAPAEQIAGAVCTAVTGTTKTLTKPAAAIPLASVALPPTAYMAMEPKKAAPKAAPKPEPTMKPGDQVTGVVIINGVPVTVNATVVDPKKP